MPQFNNKEEYEKWKAERAKEIKENPNKIKASIEPKSNRQTAKKGAINLMQKSLAKIKTMLYNWLEAFKRRQAKKSLRQQEKLQQFKNSNRKIKCPSCRNSISINAVACPKCGQPITDTARIDEIARINRTQIIIAAIIIGFILLGLLGKLLPERPESNSSRTSTGSSSPESSYSSSEAERTRKELEREEIRRKRDALQPALREGCLQGNEEACRQYKEWENMR